ncbi:hypothetical protein NVP1111B_57 [Vibrio phage 1.111.B._10N.286.45.E6]|nr:hypothetical protein NVP1111A_57 [Vibrio phage 1.111.A._10N.286.45.E6]AUR88313.1 hypothetical protein NVP1111B_57 [Vibrio phage 1.111.B._10N.286.45.E6]
MFILELSEVIKDFKTSEKSYTNYKAILFAKSPGQIGFYQNNLVVGTVVNVVCDALKVDIYEGNNGPRITLEMDNAQLKEIITAQAPQGQQQAPQQQQQYNAPAQQQAPQQAPQQTGWGQSQQPAQQQQQHNAPPCPHCNGAGCEECVRPF